MPIQGYGPSFSLALLSSLPLPDPVLPPRVRFVGRVIALDLPHSLILLEDDGYAIAVNVDLAIRAGATPMRGKERWMVWGEVTRAETPLVLPTISVTLPSSQWPSIDPTLVVKGSRMVQCEDVFDVVEWREAVRGMAKV